MVTTRLRSMAQGSDEGIQERETIRTRLKLGEARTKRIEESLAQSEAKAKGMEDSLKAIMVKLPSGR